MIIKILDRARSYLSGGQRSNIIHSEMPSGLKLPMIRRVDAESDAKINALNNVALIQLIERVLGDSLSRALEKENG